MSESSSVFRNVMVACLWCLISTAGADVVRMSNGDRLTGEVLRVEGDRVELKTDYAGTLKIQWKKVDRVEMDAPKTLKVANGDLVEVSGIKRSGDQRVELDGVNGRLDLSEDDLKVLNPTEVELGEKGEFTGRFNLSLKSERGNDFKDDLDMDCKLGYRYGDHRFGFRGGIEFDDRDGAPTKRDWYLGADYRRYLDDKWFGAYAYQAKHEKNSGLDLRQTTGPSIGYQFLEGPPISLLSEVGVMFVHEEYQQRVSKFFGPAWSLEFEQKLLNDRLVFYHDHFALISSEDLNKYLWQSWTGIRCPLTGGLVGSLEFEFDYDSQPALRRKSMDQTLRLKLGYEW